LWPSVSSMINIGDPYVGGLDEVGNLKRERIHVREVSKREFNRFVKADISNNDLNRNKSLNESDAESAMVSIK